MDPYEILGLTYPSTKEEIRARYLELAKKHHPDKHQHLPKEEIDVHEREFKRINLAYELLTKKEFASTTKKEWRGLWETLNLGELFSNPEMLRNMGDLLRNVMNIASEYKKQKASEHHITVEVSLEDVYTRKEKKLRLFLKGISDPVFITIDCGCYPSFLHTHITPDERTVFIYLTFQLIPHEIFALDTLLETNDIYMTLEIPLHEYFQGCSRTIDYLDHTSFPITIPPCPQDPIEFPEKGLYGKGKFIVFVKTILPGKEAWDRFDSKKREKLQRYLKLISNAPHSGVPEMKSI